MATLQETYTEHTSHKHIKYACRWHRSTNKQHAHTHAHTWCCGADSGWTEGCRLVKNEVLQQWWEVRTDRRDWWSLSVRSVGSSEPPSASCCSYLSLLRSVHVPFSLLEREASLWLRSPCASLSDVFFFFNGRTSCFLVSGNIKTTCTQAHLSFEKWSVDLHNYVVRYSGHIE